MECWKRREPHPRRGRSSTLRRWRPTTCPYKSTQGQGYITRAQFIEGWNKYFLPSSSSDHGDGGEMDPMLATLLARLDPRAADRIDYIEWSNTLTLRDVPELTG